MDQHRSANKLAAPMFRFARRLLAAVAAGAALASAGPASAETAETLVPVHAIAPQPANWTPNITLSGAIKARVQSNISFRVDGKITERRVEVGQHVSADQVLAVLDPTEQKADVDNAQAALSSAEALYQQATTTFERQKTLINSGYTTRSSFNSAQEALKTTQATVKSARAALSTSRERLSYTALKAGANGIVVYKSAEVGQVMQAGQTVFVVAEDGPRDAVFDIFEKLLIDAPKDRTVDVWLQADPKVRATGEVREISPTIDASTGTVEVKVGLASTPPGMALGAAVVGSGRWNQKPALVLPWSALFEWDSKPAVWVVDDAGIVSIVPVEVRSYGTGSLTIAADLDSKLRVVTAGLQFLHPGQKVAVVAGDKL